MRRIVAYNWFMPGEQMMTQWLKSGLFLTLMVASGFAEGRTASNKDLELRADETDARITALESRANQSLVALQQQIDAAKKELRTLRGELDEVSHELENAKKQQRDLYTDLDGRMLYLENAAGVPTRGANETPSAGDIISADETAVYGDAFSALKAGRYDEAERGFNMYLTKYPQGPRADSAAYWLAETRYVQQDYQNALATFESMLKQYPDSKKAPDAMLKMGYCQFELKAFKTARSTLEKVKQTYPGTDAARQAEGRLIDMDAAGR
jgi:tol-pal system protein YbgF